MSLDISVLERRVELPSVSVHRRHLTDQLTRRLFLLRIFRFGKPSRSLLGCDPEARIVNNNLLLASCRKAKFLQEIHDHDGHRDVDDCD